MRITKLILLAAIAALVVVAGNTNAWAQNCPTSPYYSPDFTSNDSCLTLNGNATFPTPAGGAATITSWTGSGSTVIFKASNSFTAGELITLSGFTHSTFFNSLAFHILNTGLSHSQFEITFSGYSGSTDTGTATPMKVLQLTPNLGNQAGSAWYDTLQRVAGGFSTTFTFQLSNTTKFNADGFAFVIQNSAELNSKGQPIALGPDGCGIGFGDSASGCTQTTGGIPNSLAVEFNTYDNSGIDQSGNSVSIQSNGPNANCVDPTCTLPGGLNYNLPVTLADGNIHTVQVSYTLLSTPTETSCLVGGNPGPCMDVIVDGHDLFPAGVSVNLSTLLSLNNVDNAWIGFTAGTGKGNDIQDILSWTYSITAQSQSGTVTQAAPTTYNYNGGFVDAPSGGNDYTAQLTTGTSVTAVVTAIPIATQAACNALVQANPLFNTAQCFVYQNGGGPGIDTPVMYELTCPGSPTGGTCGSVASQTFFATLGTDFPFTYAENSPLTPNTFGLPNLTSQNGLPAVGFLKGEGPDPLHPCTPYPNNNPPLFQSNQILSYVYLADTASKPVKSGSSGTGSCWLVTYGTPGELPTATVTAPANNAIYQQNSTQLANYSCTAINTGSNSTTGPYLTVAACTATDTPGGSVANGAQFDTSTLGTHTFVATVTDSALNTSAATVTYDVQTSQTITLTNVPSSAAYNSSFTVAASASSGLPVTLAASGSCTNLGATYTMTSGAGTCLVIANQAGNSSYSAAPQVSQAVNAAPASQTITFTTNAPSTAAYNTNFTVAATGGASGNPVTFTNGGSCSNAGATYTMTAGTETCSVIANQAGNSNYSAAATVTQNVNATKAATTVIWSNPSAIPYGTPLSPTQLNASASPVTAGNYVYNPPLGTVLGAGNQTLSVTFIPSNTNYAQSTASATLPVIPGGLTVAATSAYGTYGQPLPPLTYTMTGFVPPDTQASATTGSPSEGTAASPTSTPGPYPIVITQGSLAAGNYTFTFVNGTLMLQQAPTTAAVTSLDSSIYPNQSTTLTATVTFSGSGAAPTGIVNFMLGATTIGTGTLSPLDPTDSTATFTLNASQLALGANSVTAVYSGDANYGGSTAAAMIVTLLSPLVNFGSVNVGSAASVQTLTYNFNSPTTVAGVNILTTGASGLDYADGGSSTCTLGTAYTAGQSCNVTVAFTPSAPGLRSGGAALFAQGSNLPLMTWYLSGVGQSSAVTIDPGTQSTIATLGNGGQAYGSVVDSAGNVYVVDNANSLVIKLSAGTYTQSTIVGSGLLNPTAVTLDGAGNLYISDTGNSRVVMVPNEQGTLNAADMSAVSISGLGSPRGVATDGNGNLYIADSANGNVVEVPAGGGMQTIVASGLTSPYGVAVDASGNVYVASSNQVSEYPAGGGTPTPMGGGFNNPHGLAVDAAGAVYVADTGNSQIVRVAPGGGSQTTLAVLGITTPQNVALDAIDNLYVTDPGYVFQVNRTQAAALSFASTNVGSTSAPQTLTVSDAGNKPLTVSNLAISANFTQLPSGGTDCTSSTQLTSAAQCLAAVAFAPTVSGSLAGTFTLTDNALNNAASTQTVQLSGNATQVAQVITFTVNAPPSAIYNTSFTVAATGGASLNPVTFTSAGVCTNSGPTYTMTGGTGTCSVIANQSGNVEYSPAPQVTQAVNATLASQTIVLSNVPANAAYNSSFTVSATGGASLNPVTFTSAGVCTNSGATYSMTSGTGSCSVIANQAGNSNYSAAPQVSQNVNATLVAQTIVLGNVPANAVYNSSFTVSATGGASGNPVTFTSAGVCTNSGATYTMTSGTGSCSVIANQAGNANYSAAAQVSQNVSATVASQTINFPIIPTQTYPGTPITLAAAASSGLAVTYAVVSGPATVSGNTLTITGPGSVTVKASQGGNSNYALAAPVSQTFAVNQLPAFTSASSTTFGSGVASSFTVTATGVPTPAITGSGSLPSGIVFTSGSGTATLSGTTTAVGSYNITFTATNVAGTVTQNFTLVISGPQVTLSPTSMSFSNIKCSTYSTQTETVTNTGNGVLTISNVSLTLGQGSDSDDFEVKNYCSGSLAPAKSCTINVTYSPDEKGPQNATLVVIDNAPGGHQNVPIVGTNTCKDEGGGGE